MFTPPIDETLTLSFNTSGPQGQQAGSWTGNWFHRSSSRRLRTPARSSSTRGATGGAGAGTCR
jgi:hypothetical protein